MEVLFDLAACRMERLERYWEKDPQGPTLKKIIFAFVSGNDLSEGEAMCLVLAGGVRVLVIVG